MAKNGNAPVRRDAIGEDLEEIFDIKRAADRIG